jgi:hypothetical protein
VTTCNPNFGWANPNWNPIEPTDGGPVQTNVQPVFRTTPEAVKKILVKYASGVDFTAFIAPASDLVTEWCVNIPYAPRFPYASWRLEMIERWLAAHFYTAFHRQPIEKKLGEGTVKWDPKMGAWGFETSSYGQIAMTLDSNGSLARLNRHAKNGVRGIVVFLGSRRWPGWESGWGGAGDAPYGLGDIP